MNFFGKAKAAKAAKVERPKPNIVEIATNLQNTIDLLEKK